MKWNVDAFFAQGKSHHVCEDFAKAGFGYHGFPYAIVCDGCSSSRDTDTGSRLLAHAASVSMGWVSGGRNTFVQHEDLIIQSARQAARILDLDPQCLDATLVAAYWDREGVRVSLRGDGAAAARRRDGSLIIYSVEHEKNAPRYPSYELDPRRRSDYVEKFGDGASLTVIEGDSSITETFNGVPEPWFFPSSEFDLVLVLSDGVHSFQKIVDTPTSRTFLSVPAKEVVDQILQIQSATGKFLQRRCHKFLTRFCPSQGWQHADDFSAAAIWMREP